MIDIISAIGDAELAAVARLFREYAGSLPMDLEYQGFTSEVQNLPGAYRAPSGALLIARVDGADAGCVAVRPLEPPICEMKRLYVRPAHRRLGIGPLLVERAIGAATALGYCDMWLDTLASMTAARRLYVKAGFREIPAYGGAAAPGTMYYGLRLAPAR